MTEYFRTPGEPFSQGYSIFLRLLRPQCATFAQTRCMARLWPQKDLDPEHGNAGRQDDQDNDIEDGCSCAPACRKEAGKQPLRIASGRA